MFVSLVDFLCGSSEYECTGYKCIPRAAANHDCEGIDWCGDGTGCDSSATVGLIAGICGAVGCTILGLSIGLIIRCRIKAKLKQVIFISP